MLWAKIRTTALSAMRNSQNLYPFDIVQGSREIIPYYVNIFNLGTPSNPTGSVLRLSDNVDITNTVMPAGSTTVSGTTIILKPISGLSPRERYRVNVLYEIGSNRFDNYFFIRCEI